MNPLASPAAIDTPAWKGSVGVLGRKRIYFCSSSMTAYSLNYCLKTGVHYSFVPDLQLVDGGVKMTVNRGGFQVGARELAIVEFGAILTPGSTTTIGAVIGEIQRGIVAQLANQLQARAAHHLQGVIMTKGAVEHQVAYRQRLADQRQDLTQKPLNKLQIGRQRHVSAVAVGAAFRPPGPLTLTFTLTRFGRFGLPLTSIFGEGIA